MKTTTIIDWEWVHCDPRHCTSTGKGWARRLKELGADQDEIDSLVTRLRDGMAARIELNRIKHLAGIG